MLAPPGEVDAPTHEITRLREINSKLLMLLGHELGSPLTVILAYLRLWQERINPIDNDELDLVVGQALALKARLDDLILLDQLESDVAQFKLEAAPIGELVTRVVTQASTVFRARNLSFITGIRFTDSVLGDKEMLYRAVDHLVTNACKFSPVGATIRVVVERQGSQCRVSVIDQGIGIAPELHNRIFEPFYQVDLTRARRYGGMGIGLRLVRAIAEKHGGCVQVESRIGEGSTFTLSLPITRVTRFT